MGRRLLLGEPAEGAYGSSAAVRVGDSVFVSGLTARGEDGPAQFRAIAAKVERALSGLDASLADVVRTRVFYVRPGDHGALGSAHGELFASVRPAMSLTHVPFLPEGALVVMEVEARPGSASDRRAQAMDVPNAEAWGYSGAVRVGDEVWVCGVTAVEPDGSVTMAGDLKGQSASISARVLYMLEACGGRATDIVSTRHYTAVAYVGQSTVPERLSLMHPHHPTSAGITVQGVGPHEAAELVEVEAVIGATESRRNLNTGRPYEEEHHYSRSVRVGDVVYVSGTTSAQLDETVGSPFDAYGQTLQTLDWIKWGIEQQGLPFDDLVRTRSYVVDQENVEPVARALRERLSHLRPAATVVGVPALGRPSIVVEIEATAVRGAAPE